MVGKLILRPLDNPTTGILVGDLEIEELTRTVFMRVKYFELSDEAGIKLSEDDKIVIGYTDFLSSFEVCTNWEEINFIKDAEWESLHNVSLEVQEVSSD